MSCVDKFNFVSIFLMYFYNIDFNIMVKDDEEVFCLVGFFNELV